MIPHNARQTQNTQRYVATYNSARQALQALFSAFRFSWAQQQITDAQALDIADASQRLLPFLNLELEWGVTSSPQIKSLLRRCKAYARILSEWAGVQTGAQLSEIMKGQLLKKNKLFTELPALFGDILSFLSAMDTETQDVLTIGNFDVRLQTVAEVDWSPESVAKLKWVLTETQVMLAQAGLASYTGGSIFAFPTEYLPPSARVANGVLAYYQPSTDAFHLSVGKNVRKVLKTFLHEFGHRVYFKSLGSAGRTAWVQFFEAEQGPVAVDQILSLWEQFILDMGGDIYAKTLGSFYHALKKQDPALMPVFEIAIDALSLRDHISKSGLSLSKKQPTAYDQLVAGKDKAKSFLHPVSAYSASSPEEAFAEAFAYALAVGPRALPPMLRAALNAALPRVKMATRIAQRHLTSRLSRPVPFPV